MKLTKVKFLASTALALVLFSVSSASNAQTQSVDEDFAAKVRAAILQNPEVILEAAQAAQNKQRLAEETAQAEAAKTVRVELSAKNTPGYVLGNPNGTQTFIEFLDYRCGFCRRAHGTIKELVNENNEARVVVMMLPVLGEQSEVLARFALAAGEQGKFEAANAYMYENTIEATDASMEQAANSIGANWAKIRTDMTGESVSAKLEVHKGFAQRLQVRGTPFFITPVGTIRGAATKEEFVQAFK